MDRPRKARDPSGGATACPSVEKGQSFRNFKLLSNSLIVLLRFALHYSCFTILTFYVIN